MYSTCIACTHRFGSNTIIEHLAIGRRIAFDPLRGRLWVVCTRCSRWNLVPFDHRLEAIDECATLFAAARRRYSTATIGIARMHDGSALIHIGGSDRLELASWRYAYQFRARRLHTFLRAATGAAVGSVISAGMIGASIHEFGVFEGAFLELPAHGWALALDRHRRVCLAPSDRVDSQLLGEAQLRTAHFAFSGAEVEVTLRPNVGSKHLLTITGAEAHTLAKRIAASVNDFVGSRAHIHAALMRLDSAAFAEWIRQPGVEAAEHGSRRPSIARERWEGFGAGGFRFAGMLPADRLAMEMWLNEADEQQAFLGELRSLERQWREADELASIADSLA
ncbi:MAG TPA: hypothetical protein VGM20_08880 [Gemmatimonadales bacterium]|jgi:hypothetical protein